jgi:hypothetical protein
VFSFPGIKEMQIKTTLKISSHLLEWPKSRERTTTHASEDVAKQEHYSLLVGVQISITTIESSMEIPQKVEVRIAI